MILRIYFLKDKIVSRVPNEKKQVRVFIILTLETDLIDYQI